jgi:hypothetical protein
MSLSFLQSHWVCDVNDCWLNPAMPTVTRVALNRATKSGWAWSFLASHQFVMSRLDLRSGRLWSYDFVLMECSLYDSEAWSYSPGYISTCGGLTGWAVGGLLFSYLLLWNTRDVSLNSHSFEINMYQSLHLTACDMVKQWTHCHFLCGISIATIQLITTSTSSAALEKEAAGGCLGGGESVPKALKELKIRYREIVSERIGPDYSDGQLIRRAGFGTEDEVVPLIGKGGGGYSIVRWEGD